MSCKKTYNCDQCGTAEMSDGCIEGRFHSNAAGIDRANEKNFIYIVDGKGEKPDLCRSCLLYNLSSILGISYVKDIPGESQIMTKFTHHHPEPLDKERAFIYIPQRKE